MTHGIVSALNRNDVGVIDHGYEHFIQWTPPSTPATAAARWSTCMAKVVGINAAIASRTASSAASVCHSVEPGAYGLYAIKSGHR